MSNPKRILLIDDELGFRELASYELGARGFKVTTAADGTKGIECIKAEEFQIVVCDFLMPGMDGIATLTRIRNISPQTKFILMTGCLEEKLFGRSPSIGISAFFEKPFQFDDLVEAIEASC